MHVKEGPSSGAMEEGSWKGSQIAHSIGGVIVDLAVVDFDLIAARACEARNEDADALRRNRARSVSSSGAMEWCGVRAEGTPHPLSANFDDHAA